MPNPGLDYSKKQEGILEVQYSVIPWARTMRFSKYGAVCIIIPQNNAGYALFIRKYTRENYEP